MIKVQKKYTQQQHAKLRKELAMLRKGEGLFPAGLQNKPTLRAVVARFMDVQPDGITNNQIYNFLLTELARLPKNTTYTALKNAFGVTDASGSLLERRAHLAAQIQKHPDTIERYENRALSNFATFLLEVEPVVTADIAPAPYIQKLEKHAATVRKMAAISLGDHLSLGERAEDLVKYLELSHKPYLDTVIAIALLPSSRGPEWYRFKLTYTFKGARDTFRIAVVLAGKDGERLMKTGLIDDFHQLNNAANAAREIKTIIANSKFILRNPTHNTQKLLRLQELEPDVAVQLLQSADATSLDCWLLEVAIPGEWQAHDITYEYQSVINLRVNEHYAYWYSPGLLYLKKLTFDFSAFPNADSWRFFLRPFLGHNSGMLHEKERLFTLAANSWIMPGHGIALVWQE